MTARSPQQRADDLLELDCVLLLERLKMPVPEKSSDVFAATLAHVRSVMAAATGGNYAILHALQLRESRLAAALSRAVEGC